MILFRMFMEKEPRDLEVLNIFSANKIRFSMTSELSFSDIELPPVTVFVNFSD